MEWHFLQGEAAKLKQVGLMPAHSYMQSSDVKKSSSFPYVHLKCVTNIMHKNCIFQSTGGPVTQVILISPKNKWEFRSRSRARVLSAFRPWMKAVRSSITEWCSWTGQDPASLYTDPASGTAVLQGQGSLVTTALVPAFPSSAGKSDF